MVKRSRVKFSPGNLRRRREEMGLSRERLARVLGPSTSTVQRWELGESEPTASVFLNLSQILRAEPALFAEVERVAS